MNPKLVIFLAFISLSLCEESNIDDIDYSLSKWTNCGGTEWQSPIDFSYFRPPINMKFPAYPKFVLNNTFYSPINNKKFEYLNSKEHNMSGLSPSLVNPVNYLGMRVDGSGSAFFLYYNKTVVFDLKELRLHVYSEHTFEGHKMDLELQLVHQLNEDKSEVDNVNKHLTMSILFSIARNKKSKFIEDIIEENEDITDERLRYTFGLVKSLDLNQFFNFNEPYYLYEGSGTTPFDCATPMTWLVNKKVEYLSEKQFRRIHIAMMDYKKSGTVNYNHYPNGNSRKVNVLHDQKRDITFVENTDRDGDDV